MNHFLMSCCVILLVALIPTSGLAQQPETLPVEYRLICTDALAQIGKLDFQLNPEVISKLELSPEEAKAVKAITDKYVAHRDKPDAENAGHIFAISRAVEATKKAPGIFEPVQLESRLQNQREYILAELSLRKEFVASIKRILSNERQAKWRAFAVRKELDVYGLNRIVLTDSQEVQVMVICGSAATKLIALDADPDVHSVANIMDDAREQCASKVLTAEQRKAIGFPWTIKERIDVKDLPLGKDRPASQK